MSKALVVAAAVLAEVAGPGPGVEAALSPVTVGKWGLDATSNVDVRAAVAWITLSHSGRSKSCSLMGSLLCAAWLSRVRHLGTQRVRA